MSPALSLVDLTVEFPTEGGAIKAVDRVTLDVLPGEILAVVGESGSGKTACLIGALGLLPSARVEGKALLDDKDLLSLNDRELYALRGRKVSVIFQDSLAALNPLMTVGDQVAEAIAVHNPDLGRRAVTDRTIDLIETVGIAAAKSRRSQYPHELSGGMRQRIAIAIAIANEPNVIVADEPTTALDVTIQAQILDVFQRIQERSSSAIVFVTHDLGLVAGIAHRVAVFYAGRLVEVGPVDEVFYVPGHPYTIGLLGSIPGSSHSGSRRLRQIPGLPPHPTQLPAGCAFNPRCPLAEMPEPCGSRLPALREAGKSEKVSKGPALHMAACHFTERSVEARQSHGSQNGEFVHVSASRKKRIAIDVRNVEKFYPLRSGALGRKRGLVRALDGVNLEVPEGETLGVVGESGSGKSTLGELVVHLAEPTSGTITPSPNRRRRPFWNRRRGQKNVGPQIVLQDPYTSLNPRFTVQQILAEPLRLNGRWNRSSSQEDIEEILATVGLDRSALFRYPSEFSGGQRQRIGIARSLVLNPDILVLDEPVSALDVSIQAGILNLLVDLQDELGITYLFISHDLGVVRHISDAVAVMYLGKIMELGPVDRIYNDPAHPYTVALLSAVPVPDPHRERSRERIILEGDIPSPADPPSGCPFRTRCWKAEDLCSTLTPPLRDVVGGGSVACHFPEAAIAERQD